MLLNAFELPSMSRDVVFERVDVGVSCMSWSPFMRHGDVDQWTIKLSSYKCNIIKGIVMSSSTCGNSTGVVFIRIFTAVVKRIALATCFWVCSCNNDMFQKMLRDCCQNRDLRHRHDHNHQQEHRRHQHKQLLRDIKKEPNQVHQRNHPNS